MSDLNCLTMTSSNGNIFHVTDLLCGQFTGEFPSQRPVMWSFDVFFDLRLNKRLSKQSRRRWSERHRTHYNVTVMFILHEYGRLHLGYRQKFHLHLLSGSKYETKCGLEWRTVYALTRGWFRCFSPSCEATNEINTEITLEWALKQFATTVHISFYFLHEIMGR